MRQLLACLALVVVASGWREGLYAGPPIVAPSTPAANADVKALREMLWGSKGQLQHWNTLPALTVLVPVMEYHTGDPTRYAATTQRLSDQDIRGLVADLSDALETLTVNQFGRFDRITREDVRPGESVKMTRPGEIVVGRFHGLQSLSHTLGFGGRSAKPDGTILGGALLLDNDYDRDSGLRKLLRTHELGHALGYNHVTARASIMNPSIGPEFNELDREAAMIAFPGQN